MPSSVAAETMFPEVSSALMQSRRSAASRLWESSTMEDDESEGDMLDGPPR